MQKDTPEMQEYFRLDEEQQGADSTKFSSGSLKGKAKRGEIVAMTIGIIANDGYPGFSMRNIARRLGIRLAAVQYYFPTKKELLCATIEKTVEGFNNEMEEIADLRNKSPEWRLEAVSRVMLPAPLDPVSNGFFVALCTRDT